MTYTTLAFVQTAANFARNATEEYSLGGGYPVTRYNKLTYGIVDNAGNATTATVNNFSSPSSVAGPDLISGRVAITGSTKLVRVDLPYGPGRYRIKAGLRTTSAVNNGIKISQSNGGATIFEYSTSSAPTSSQVLGIDGTVYADATAWWAAGGGNYIEFTALNSSIYIAKSSAANLSLSAILLEYQPDPLNPLGVVQPEEFGASAGSRAIDTVFAKQPAGEPFARILVTNGVPNVTIEAGGLMPYLALGNIEINGQNYLGLYHTATPIPDGFANRTLTLRQTTTFETKDTVLNFPNMVDAPGKPTTGDLALMPTQMWLVREKVRTTVFNNAWRGYQGQTIVQTQQITSTADFISKWAALNPNGTSWYAFEFQPGVTYTGNVGDLAVKNFGTGGILFTRAAGSDPEIRFYGRFLGARVDFGDLRYPQYGTGSGNASLHQFTFADPAVTGTTIYNHICIDRARIGWMFSDLAQGSASAVAQQQVVDDWAAGKFFSGFMLIYHAESYCADGTWFSGNQNHVKMYSIRYALNRPLVEYPNSDIGALAQIYDQSTTKGVFADDDCFMWYEPTLHNNLDYVGLNSAAHSDLGQVRTWAQGTEPPRYPSNGASNNTASSFAKWRDPANWYSMCTSPKNGTRWLCSVATGTQFTGPGTPPEFSADPSTLVVDTTTVVDGDVTWVYKGTMKAWGCKQYVWIVNAALHCGSIISGSAPASIQSFINSNAGYGYPCIVGMENSIFATANSRGIDNVGFRVGSGDTNLPYNEVYGWRTTFYCPADSNEQVGAGRYYCSAGTNSMTRRCIFGIRDSIPNWGRMGSHDDAVVDYLNGAVNPGANFRMGAAACEWVSRTDSTKGPFSFWRYLLGFQDVGYDRDGFRGALSKALHYVNGSKGARLKETHTVTVTDSLGKTAQFTLETFP